MSIYHYLCLISSLLVVSCQSPRAHLTYAEKDYLKNKSKQLYSGQKDQINQPTREDLRVDTHDYRYDSWERQGYETIEEWTNRLASLLELNRDLYLLNKPKFESLREQELSSLSQIHKLKKLNSSIEKWIEKHTNAVNDKITVKGINLGQAPFTVHIVKKGESLCSISRLYYGTHEKAEQIFSWNQSWLRNPNQLLTGTALVLFFDLSKVDRNQSIVNLYMQKVERDINFQADK